MDFGIEDFGRRILDSSRSPFLNSVRNFAPVESLPRRCRLMNGVDDKSIDVLFLRLVA